MLNKLAYLGPSGTFCEEAATKYIGDKAWMLLPYPSIEAVFAAVQLGEVESGIVPIENSCEGAVNLTMDLLAYEYDLKITGELVLPVSQNLMIRPGVKLDEISCILSHPQALAQCRKYLSGTLSAGNSLLLTALPKQPGEWPIQMNPGQPWVPPGLPVLMAWRFCAPTSKTA